MSQYARQNPEEFAAPATARANRGMDCDALDAHYREMDVTDYLNDHDLMPTPENRAKALDALTAHL